MVEKFEIKKFNGNNFGLWKMKMKVVLRKENCLEAIGENLKNVENISKLQLTKEICDTLTKLYEAKLLHNKIFLKRKLYTL